MQVILLKKIHRLGNLGDEVKVKAGYARNYLIPQRMGLLATSANRKYFVDKRSELEAKELQDLNEATAKASALEKLNIILKERVGDGGRLYGSVRSHEIAKVITSNHGISIKPQEIILTAGSIHEIGEHEISIRLHSQVSVKIKILVEGIE